MLYATERELFDVCLQPDRCFTRLDLIMMSSQMLGAISQTPPKRQDWNEQTHKRFANLHRLLMTRTQVAIRKWMGEMSQPLSPIITS